MAVPWQVQMRLNSRCSPAPLCLLPRALLFGRRSFFLCLQAERRDGLVHDSGGFSMRSADSWFFHDALDCSSRCRSCHRANRARDHPRVGRADQLVPMGRRVRPFAQRHDRLAAVPDRAARRVRLALGRIVDHAVCMCDAPSRALAATFGPAASQTHTRATSQAHQCIPSLMDPRWAYLSVFVFDFNALGVVHVPHLRKPTGRRRGRGGAGGGGRIRTSSPGDDCRPAGRLDTRDVREVAPSGAVEQR